MAATASLSSARPPSRSRSLIQRIGTDEAGDSGLGNTGNGISIDGGSRNTIGGNQGVANVISGNGENGISIHASPLNIILGNRIGVVNGDGKVSVAEQI